MKKIKFFLPAMALFLFSCNDYLDVNQNLNEVPYEKLKPKDLLSAAQSEVFRTQTVDMNELGNVFMNSWGGNVSQVTGGFAREFQLTIDNGFRNGIWNNLYLNINNLEQINKYPNANGSFDNYIAVAKILKAHYMQYIVDLYGDAPYSEAFQGSKNTTPKYDDDLEIYKGLISELEAAVSIIQAGNSQAEDISSVDVMLHGDMTRWEQFANTIKLRMLLRMSNVTGALATYRDSKLATLSGATFISQDVTVNPGYSNASEDSMNPFYANNVTNAAGTAAQFNLNFICPTGHAYKSLSAYTSYPAGASTEIIVGSGINYPNLSDSRRGRIFRNGASTTTFRAVTQGSGVVDVFAPSATAGAPGRIGIGVLNPYGQSTLPNGLLTDLTVVDGYVMTKAESYFLQAEAALRYPALFSNASGNFNSGVTASFQFHSASIGTYLTTINTNKPNFGFNVANTFNQNLHAIMYQKWIALMGVHGIESFIDYNRTGYPLTPLATTATQTRKPRRLIYPVSEYVANSANVPNVTPSQIFATTDASHPFWMN